MTEKYLVIYNDHSQGLLPIKLDTRKDMENFVNGLLNDGVEPDEIMVLTGNNIQAFDVAETKTFKLNTIPDDDMDPNPEDLDDVKEEDLEEMAKTTVPLKKRN